jgi:hypothetical protein
MPPATAPRRAESRADSLGSERFLAVKLRRKASRTLATGAENSQIERRSPVRSTASRKAALQSMKK